LRLNRGNRPGATPDLTVGRTPFLLVGSGFEHGQELYKRSEAQKGRKVLCRMSTWPARSLRWGRARGLLPDLLTFW